MDVYFTPYQALELQAGYYGVPKAERRTEEILAALGLMDKRDAYVRQLSGGMKRRLLIGKALVHNPPVLILDEPTAGVDIELRRQMWDYVQELHSRGTTIILTTHYLEEAEALCDRIAIIHNGEVTANEEKTTLLSRLDKRKLVITPTEKVDAVPDGLSKLDVELLDNGNLSISYRMGKDSISGITPAMEPKISDCVTRVKAKKLSSAKSVSRKAMGKTNSKLHCGLFSDMRRIPKPIIASNTKAQRIIKGISHTRDSNFIARPFSSSWERTSTAAAPE